MLTVQTLMQEARVIPKARTRRRLLGLKEERELMAAAITKLPELPRLVLSLRYYESLRPVQIAAAIGISEAEVCQVLFQALQLVHAALGLNDASGPGRKAQSAASLGRKRSR